MARAERERCAILGGGGHVGIPLRLALAEVGFRVRLIDRDDERSEAVRSGRLPLREHGCVRVARSS